MYFFKCQKFVLNGLKKKKKIPEIEDFAALCAYIINYIRVLVPNDAYLIYYSESICTSTPSVV